MHCGHGSSPQLATHVLAPSKRLDVFHVRNQVVVLLKLDQNACVHDAPNTKYLSSLVLLTLLMCLEA